MTDTSEQISNSAFFFEVAGVALTFRFLFYVNDWFFSYVKVSSHVSWIFLPAAIRVLAVLLFGWRGVIGLFIGGLVTNVPMYGWLKIDTYAYAALSAFIPMLAVSLGSYLMNTKADLCGFKAWQLFVFGLLGAFFNSVAQNLYFQMTGIVVKLDTTFLPMFVGDTAGTLIMLYLAAIVLRLFPLLSTNPRED